MLLQTNTLYWALSKLTPSYKFINSSGGKAIKPKVKKQFLTKIPALRYG
jgi:hypothetical protein